MLIRKYRFWLEVDLYNWWCGCPDSSIDIFAGYNPYIWRRKYQVWYANSNPNVPPISG